MTNLGRDDKSIAIKIRDAIKSVVGDGPVGLHEPAFYGNEKKYLNDCLKSTFVSSVGEYVNNFENQLCEYTKSKFAVAVSNGTSALHISLLLSDVKRNDEVLIPSLSFVATANAVSYCGAIPHFVDIDEHTLGISSDALLDYIKYISTIENGKCINKKTGRIIKAIVPMHTFGHAVSLDNILKIASDHKIAVVEDAAESLGTFYKGKHTGTYGLFGALSFNGNKIITTGGGGAILTQNKELALKAKHITTTAKLPHKWRFTHDQIAYNYRMPNINAALGCAQIEQLPIFLKKKRNLYRKYKEAFKSINEVNLFEESSGSQSNYWLQTIILKRGHEHLRDSILELTNSSGFMTRPSWDLLHTLNPYKKFPRARLPLSQSLEKRIINIPSSKYN